MNEHRPNPPVTYETIKGRLERVLAHLNEQNDRHLAATQTEPPDTVGGRP